MLKNVVRYIWNTEIIPKEWDLERLMILPKKGYLSLTKNHCGLIFMEISFKIVAKLIHSRLLPIQELLDHEPDLDLEEMVQKPRLQ